MGATTMIGITSRRPAVRRRHGFSITELLVASGIGLTVMAAVASLFGVFSRALSQSQSTVDMSARMRATAWKLRQDLEGVTCPIEPWLAPEANAGYFEISEGKRQDAWAGQGAPSLEADTDDILMFTTRAPSGGFSGRYLNSDRTIESPYAEVAWFCQVARNQPVPTTTVYNLHRRQLLVMGYVGLPEFSGNSISGTLPTIAYDISLRSEAGRLYPNTLGDLTKRENRFMHGSTPPHLIAADPTTERMLPAGTFVTTERESEDVVLTNVISFDVRVFDPQSRAQVAGDVTRYPGDPGYSAGAGAYGAYIDLGRVPGVRLGQAPDPKAGMPRPTYDTWSQHYEFTAAGRSGLNDPAVYATAPPYPVPLEGIEVRIRCYDPSSKQVRQVTIRHSFRGS
jgi:type II secretory pathway component PulJ